MSGNVTILYLVASRFRHTHTHTLTAHVIPHTIIIDTCNGTYMKLDTHTHTLTTAPVHAHVHVHMHTLTTAPVTKSGDSMLVLSVREGKLDVIKYFVSEVSVDIKGEFGG